MSKVSASANDLFEALYGNDFTKEEVEASDQYKCIRNHLVAEFADMLNEENPGELQSSYEALCKLSDQQRARIAELEAQLNWSNSPAPKDGRKIEVKKHPETWKWVKYKPGSAKSLLKRVGRWQRMVWNGDFFKWENCNSEPGEWRELNPAPGFE